jgi:hypothetical protein
MDAVPAGRFSVPYKKEIKQMSSTGRRPVQVAQDVYLTPAYCVEKLLPWLSFVPFNLPFRAPVSAAAADPSDAVCDIAANQIIAVLEPSEALCDAHQSATDKVAVARALVIQAVR